MLCCQEKCGGNGRAQKGSLLGIPLAFILPAAIGQRSRWSRGVERCVAGGFEQDRLASHCKKPHREETEQYPSPANPRVHTMVRISNASTDDKGSECDCCERYQSPPGLEGGCSCV